MKLINTFSLMRDKLDDPLYKQIAHKFLCRFKDATFTSFYGNISFQISNLRNNLSWDEQIRK